MTNEEALAVVASLSEALTTLLTEVPKVEESPKEDLKAKKSSGKKAKKETKEEPKKEEPVEDDLFGDDEPEVEKKTPEDVKILVLDWIQLDEDKNRHSAKGLFKDVTGLEKMNEVTDKNATEVYGKLVEAFKK